VAQTRLGPRSPRTGVVTEFDDDRGLGSVLGDDGQHYRFHCAAVVDGTRTIAVGTRVVFAVAPGHGGRYEARSIIDIGTTGQSV
jgi:cold shock CspA family protein